ncbi:MAG TPA: non-homologous end-joining DNA ligase [Candidatus Limnocylindrales bacterium]|nr:non-homologous end-joining DNA ligase [Candidatus Limnocylindrales bacterium]
MIVDDDIAYTHLDRVLWPTTGTTKAELVRYYAEIAPVLVPHIKGRPLMLGRWPEGVNARGWGQFECRGRPSWMASYPLRLRDGRVVDVCVVDDERSLLWLAQQGVVELHAYLARMNAFDQPLSVIFDLDPGAPAGLPECRDVALLLREALAARGLGAVVKTSGATGLHVSVPIAEGPRFAETKQFARSLAAGLVARRPDLVIDRMSREERRARVFIDWSQNDERKQTVAPYSVRAMSRPFVSTPISWNELANSDPGALRFTMHDVPSRVARYGDLFATPEVAAQTRRLG